MAAVSVKRFIDHSRKYHNIPQCSSFVTPVSLDAIPAFSFHDVHTRGRLSFLSPRVPSPSWYFKLHDNVAVKMGVKIAPRETEDNAYAKFWGDKQRVLWYVRVFSGAVHGVLVHYSFLLAVKRI